MSAIGKFIPKSGAECRVKPPFGGTQSRMQWLNQIEAVKRNEAYAEYEKIYFKNISLCPVCLMGLIRRKTWQLRLMSHSTY